MPSRISVQATAYLQNSLAASDLENLLADFAECTAKMSTPQDKALMQHFAEIAKEFILSGKIIA